MADHVLLSDISNGTYLKLAIAQARGSVRKKRRTTPATPWKASRPQSVTFSMRRAIRA